MKKSSPTSGCCCLIFYWWCDKIGCSLFLQSVAGLGQILRFASLLYCALLFKNLEEHFFFYGTQSQKLERTFSKCTVVYSFFNLWLSSANEDQRQLDSNKTIHTWSPCLLKLPKSFWAEAEWLAFRYFPQWMFLLRRDCVQCLDPVVTFTLPSGVPVSHRSCCWMLSTVNLGWCSRL